MKLIWNPYLIAVVLLFHLQVSSSNVRLVDVPTLELKDRSPLAYDANQQFASTFRVTGTLSYLDKDGLYKPGRNYLCRVMDDDLYSADDLLWEAETGRYGYFESPFLNNYDEDEADQTNGNRLIDVYVFCRTRNSNLGQVLIHPQLRTPYAFFSAIWKDINLAQIDRSMTVTQSNNLPAMWLFEDMLRTYEYWDIFSGYDPVSVTTVWQPEVLSYRSCTETSCFLIPQYPTYPTPEIFISDLYRFSSDNVVHELGHAYVYGLAGSLGSCPGPHGIKSSSTLSCAWSEGWSEYFALFMNSDGCYDFGIGPCSGSHVDLENASFRDNPLTFNFGESVEGRIAGALYDLTDGNNESFDPVGLPLEFVADVVIPFPLEKNFAEFWNGWLTLDNGYENELNSIFF